MAGYTVSSVTSGKYARQVTVSASGPQGAQGPAGPQGAKGDTGVTGGLSAKFKFLNSYSATNPGGGYFAFNNSSFMSATELYLSDADVNTDSQSSILAAMIQSTNDRKAVITLQRASDPRKFARFYVTGGTNNSGWWDYQIAYIDGTILSWIYNEAVELIVAPIGDRGLSGPTGAQGAPGVGVPAGGLVGQILRKLSGGDYDTEWVDAEAVQDVSMTELTDVNVSSVVDGQVLIYNEATHTWLPASPTTLPQLGDNLSGTIEGGTATTF